MDDSAPNWDDDEWVGYTVVAQNTDTTQVGDPLQNRITIGDIAMVTSNTDDTLTVTYTAGGYGQNTHWQSGDTYKLYKVLQALDQPGRGRGDWIEGGYNNNPPLTRNSVTDTELWPDPALEPSYSWNNFYDPEGTPVAKGFSGGIPSWLVEGTDYYNGSTEAAATAKYVEALNGEDYGGTYDYPHPLQSEEAVGGGTLTCATLTVATLTVIG